MRSFPGLSDYKSSRSAVNSNFGLPKLTNRRPLLIALIGPGGVGSEVLNQLHTITARLKSEQRLLPQVRVICNSRDMYLATSAVDLGWWRGELETYGEPANLDRLTSYLAVYQGPVAVVDTTASDEVAHYHREWLRCGFTVLTANKAAAAASYQDYQSLIEAEKKGGGAYHHETTVGAGLPIISVIKNLVDTGDEITSIQGILSGTISHIIAGIEAGKTFSDTLTYLHSSGYTEPDPREDLLGLDFARKLVILARAAKMPLNIADIEVTPFVDINEGKELSIKQFTDTLTSYDEKVAGLVNKACQNSGVLRYTGAIHKNGKAKIGLEYLNQGHSLARSGAGENLIAIYTRRYQETPLIIQGLGAGREVTASGILADLLKLV